MALTACCTAGWGWACCTWFCQGNHAGDGLATHLFLYERDMKKTIYTTREAGDELGITEHHAKRLARLGVFPNAVKFAGVWAIPARDIRAFQRKKAKKAAAK